MTKIPVSLRKTGIFQRKGPKMARTNNYLIQAAQAKQHFLTYDQEKLIRKLSLAADGDFLYTTMLYSPYRISRHTGDLERREGDAWVDANTFAEVMTLLDLVCDSREDRWISGKWKNMSGFGLMFHQDLLEDARSPWAERFQDDQEGFCWACQALGARRLNIGNISWGVELFDGLEIALQLWLGDEEFPPNLRILWDENALQYIRYETMYFAKGMLLDRLWEQMQK